MTTYSASLTLDFGLVGYRAGEAFCVVLETPSLQALLADAHRAHRVYELLLIQRPGDVWNYVTVVPLEVSRSLAERMNAVRPSPVASLPFNVFDRLFHWAGDDTEPEDAVWLGHRSAPAMQAFAQQLLAAARTAAAAINWNDHLLRHIVAQVRQGIHSYDLLDRRVAVKRGLASPPRAPAHSDGFYRELRRMVREGSVCSVAYRAPGDHQVLRVLATEQRRRANLTGHIAGAALQISALVNQTISNEAWGSEINFFSEGLAHGDLWVEGGAVGGSRVKALIATGWRVPGFGILSAQDEGDITGFERTAGDGWFVYRSQTPHSRRLGLGGLNTANHGVGEPVLRFADTAAAVFGHERAVFLVGDKVSAQTCAALATVLQDWCLVGHSPVVLVFALSMPLELARFGAVMCPVAAPDSGLPAADKWLWGVLQNLCPWTDVIVALDSPLWANRVMAQKARGETSCWQPWVVASQGVFGLQADIALDKNAAQQLLDAHRKAQAHRPQLL